MLPSHTYSDIASRCMYGGPITRGASTSTDMEARRCGDRQVGERVLEALVWPASQLGRYQLLPLSYRSRWRYFNIRWLQSRGKSTRVTTRPA